MEAGKNLERRWYAVHTYSGYENKVKSNLERKVSSLGLEDKIFNVLVPVKDEVEKKNGVEKVTKRKLFPGYVFVEMIVNEKTWFDVRNTDGVTGFVGSGTDPTPIGEEEDSHLGDFVPDESNMSPEDFTIHEMLKEEISDFLLTLTEREEQVLRLRFGLDDGASKTLEEVGQMFGVTRERIRQIEAKALRKLRHPSRSRKLKDFLNE